MTGGRPHSDPTLDPRGGPMAMAVHDSRAALFASDGNPADCSAIADALLAALDASDLIVTTPDALRSAVEAHEEWAGKGRVEPSSPDCGEDVLARLRGRLRVSRG